MNSEQDARMFTFYGWLAIGIMCSILAAFDVLYEGLTLFIFVGAVLAYVGCFLMMGCFVWWLIKKAVEQ